MLGFLLTVVFISLSGVMMPGPVFAVTVAKGQREATAGAWIGVGHGIIEFPLMFLIYFGFGSLISSGYVKTGIGILGGLMLIYMGYGLIKERHQLSSGQKDLPYNSILAGFITTAVNPYFFLWWATVGAALILQGLDFGFVGFLLFAVVHWLCDFIWYFFVSASIRRTSHLWSSNWQRFLFMGCGILLIGFGGWFLSSSLY